MLNESPSLWSQQILAPSSVSSSSDLIFVTATRGSTRHVFMYSLHNRCGEIWKFSHLWCGEIQISPDVEKFEISPHLSCGEDSDFSTWQMWGNLFLNLICHLHYYRISSVYNLWCSVTFSLFCIFKFALFCRDLHAFAWKKKLCSWRKNDKLSSLPGDIYGGWTQHCDWLERWWGPFLYTRVRFWSKDESDNWWS